MTLEEESVLDYAATLLDEMGRTLKAGKTHLVTLKEELTNAQEAESTAKVNVNVMIHSTDIDARLLQEKRDELLHSVLATEKPEAYAVYVEYQCEGRVECSHCGRSEEVKCDRELIESGKSLEAVAAELNKQEWKVVGQSHPWAEQYGFAGGLLCHECYTKHDQPPEVEHA